VSIAYDAFRNATGRELNVPLQGLAQDYARLVDDFGDAIPSAVRNKFEREDTFDKMKAPDSSQSNPVFNVLPLRLSKP
jgi:hypothetical protein